MSRIGMDFSCIVLPKLRTPVSDKNKMSVPVCCTESRAIQPTPSTVSARVIEAGDSAPEYTSIDFLPKMIRKPLWADNATISSYPVGHTVVTSSEPDVPPVQWCPLSRSDQYTVCLLPVTSAAHKRPYAAKTSLASGGVPVAWLCAECSSNTNAPPWSVPRTYSWSRWNKYTWSFKVTAFQLLAVGV